MSGRTLVVFAREPKPGLVKTRLARDIGDDAAAELYAAMLRDVFELAAGIEGCRKVICWAAYGAIPAAYGEYPFEHRLQEGQDLGERMAHGFSTVFAEGLSPCCLIGSDSPDLPHSHVTQAFALLESGADAVFGPSDDGGYYLVGMSRLHPELFKGIAWGTAEVLQQSLRRAGLLGLRAAKLTGWYDIDTLDDLNRLLMSGSPAAPHTRNAARLIARKALP